MRKLKFSEFEQIVQGYSLTSHAVQCQNSCCCYFTKNWECIKSYWLQADAHCACMLSHFNRVLLFVTLWTIACQAPLSMGFSRQEYWSGLPCPPPGDLLDPGIKPTSLTSSVLAGGLFTTAPSWSFGVNSVSFQSGLWLGFLTGLLSKPCESPASLDTAATSWDASDMWIVRDQGMNTVVC